MTPGIAALVAAVALGAAAKGGAPAPADGGACLSPGPPDLARLQRVLDYQGGAQADHLGSGARTGQSALRSHLPVMPGAVTPLTDISDGMVTYGVPMNLAVFETEATDSQVLHFYAEYFRQRGWDFSAPRETAEVVPYPALSATSGPEELQLSVMVMGREPKGSTVVLGLADMKAVKEKGGNSWKEPELRDLPFYPHSDPMAMSSQDGDRRSLTVSFDTPDARDRVAGFFRQEMATRGYEEAPDPLPAEDRVTHLQFMKAGHAWTLALSPWQGRTFVTAQGTEESAR